MFELPCLSYSVQTTVFRLLCLSDHVWAIGFGLLCLGYHVSSCPVVSLPPPSPVFDITNIRDHFDPEVHAQISLLLPPAVLCALLYLYFPFLILDPSLFLTVSLVPPLFLWNILLDLDMRSLPFSSPNKLSSSTQTSSMSVSLPVCQHTLN